MRNPRSLPIILTILLMAVAAPSAIADDAAPTVQAQELNATFLAYVPAPPTGPGAVCIVDSGVNLNPDTSASVVLRDSIDPAQTGDDARGRLSDGSLYPHGTLMAMLGAGPRNGWGAVGIWPAAKVVSVNGMPYGSHDFPIASYNQGIRRCVSLASSFPIHVILLALGHTGSASAFEATLLENSVYAARANGINVVASAGNDGGAVNWPAAFPPVVAVAAGKLARGGLCDFSSRGTLVDAIVPGCDIDQADPDTGAPQWGSGTSQASALEAFVIDALKSHRPDLDPDAIEQLFATTSHDGVPDVRAAFVAAGLLGVVETAEAAEAAAAVRTPSPPNVERVPVLDPAPASDERTSRLQRWRRPVAIVRRHGQVLVVAVRKRPPAARLAVDVQRAWEGGWSSIARRTRRGNRLYINIRPNWRRSGVPLRAVVSYARDHAHMPSRPVIIRL